MKNSLKLKSSELKAFIHGTMLGDSKIERNGKVFSSKQISKDLIDFKYQIMLDHFGEKAVSYKTTPAHFCGKWNHQELFEVRVKHEYFKKMFPKFYNGERKFLSMDQLKPLTNLGLALWFADDGTTILLGRKSGKIKNRRVLLCTECYNYEEHLIIQKYFRLFHGYDVRIVGRDNGDGKKGKFRISFTLLDAQDFLTKIGPYFIKYFPSLLYKLDMGYRDFNSTRITKNYSEFFNECVKTHSSFIDRTIIEL
jgi:hypothetical protein